MSDNIRKTALVTGASRGIGRAVAVRLAKSGYNVVVNYSGNDVAADETVSLCKKENVDSIAIKTNVADFAEVDNMIKTVMDRFGRIDCLVNNAGITKDKLILGMKEEDFDDVIAINLKGVFNTIKMVTPIMLKQKSGNIVNITSITGLCGNAGQVNYAAAKAGVIGITKTVAKELAAKNIRCNAVAPGFTKTDMTAKMKDDVFAKATEAIPLKRAGEPEDVANLVNFLAGDESSYITGEVIKVDGGLYM